MEKKKFYVYFLRDPRNYEVFIIGKGCNGRMYVHVEEVKRGRIPNNNKKEFYKICSILNEGFDDVIYDQVYWTNDEEDAYNTEEELQKFFGLENLCNICIGARTPTHSGKTYEQMYGKEKAETMKQNSSERIKGKTFEERFGKEKADKIKSKISRLKKGKSFNTLCGGIEKANKIRKKLSEKYKNKSLIERYGEKKADEIKTKIVIGLKKRIRKKETYEKISKANTGKKRTIEQRKRMSGSHIGTPSSKKGRTFEEMYGKEKAEEMKKQQSNTLKTHYHNEYLASIIDGE